MTPFAQWSRAVLEAGSLDEIQAILAQCRESLAAGDKVGWPGAARNALFEDDLRAASDVLGREELAFRGEPDAMAALRGVAGVFRAAARRLDELE